jgi:chromosome segregation ATPase
MDQELVTYLDRRFDQLDMDLDRRFAQVERRFEETNRQIAENRRHLVEHDRRFDQIDERFEQIDQRFEQVDQRFEQVELRLDQHDQRFEQQDQRFESLETQLRHTNVVVEGIAGDVKAVAEAVITFDGKLDRYQEEMRSECAQIRSLLEVSHGRLDRRVSTLEERVDGHEGRLTALEGGGG